VALSNCRVEWRNLHMTVLLAFISSFGERDCRERPAQPSTDHQDLFGIIAAHFGSLLSCLQAVRSGRG
jgi:hypothetical protein